MRNRNRGGVIVMLSVLAVAAAAPTAAQTGTDERVWTALSVQGRAGAGSAWKWASDSLVRTRDGAGTLDFAAERIIVTRELTARTTAGVGYAYGAGFSDAGTLREHRFVQQYSYGAGVGRRLTLRSRLEERLVSGHRAVRFRVRQDVRMTWPLAGSGRLLGVASEEILVQVNSTARSSAGLEGSRTFLGIGRQLTPMTRMEAGYLHVRTHGVTRRPRSTHVMSATVVVSL